MSIPKKQPDTAPPSISLVTSSRSTGRSWLRAAAALVLFGAGSYVAVSAHSPVPSAVTPARAIGERPRYGLAATSASNGRGAIYNLRVVSDSSPDLTDLGSLVSSITAGWPTDREKVWALYYWSHILKRQTPPMLVHGFELADPVRNFADYGFTDCSTISGINQALYEVIGLRHQFWDICNHTVSQVEYDGSFHMIDSSLSNLVTSDDGSRLASVEEAAADDGRLVRQRSLYASSPGGFLTGADGMRNLVATTFTDGSTLAGLENAFCAAGLKLRDYAYNWDAGHRYVLNLKDGESYTRYYRKLGDTADYFVGTEPADAPDPTQKFDPEASSNMGVRANGRWSFTPDLTAAGFAGALYSFSNIGAADTVGITPVASGQPGVAIYKIQSANVVTSQFIRATFSKIDAQADAEIAISRNHGRRWQLVGQLGTVTGSAIPLDIPLGDQVNGAYELLIRIQMTSAAPAPPAVVLRALTVETITQVNAKALPTLNLGRNQISIGEGEQTDTMVLWPELRGDRWQDDAYDFQNIASQPATLPQIWTPVVYPADIGQDAYLTYRMEAPNDITRLVYGGRLHNYFAGSYIDYLHSFDGGATWIRSYRFDSVASPWDVIHYETVTDVPPGTRTVLFRFLFHSTGGEGGRASGLYNARMEANHLPVNGVNAPLEVIWHWAEVQADRTLVERSHKQRVTSFPFTYDINVGGVDHPVMRSMRVNLEGSGDGAPSGYADATDVGGVKYVHRWRTDGLNLAQGRPYSVSRPPSVFQESAGAASTTILTDGVVGAPATGGLTYRWGACWDAGADLDITIDLGAALTAGAFRGHIFGWPDWDALKGEVGDRVEVLTSLDGVNFESRGLLQTSLWKKDVPINYMLRDDDTATAWNFELQPGSPVQARYVTYHITPARVVCVSELQVLDRVTYTPFDIRLSPPGSRGSSATWPFTIAPAAPQPPAAANSPAPADGAAGIGTSPTLTWNAPGATAYDVSFGRTNPPPPVTIGQTVAAYPTPALEWGTTYFWQVVARNGNGSVAGPVWSFSTAPAPPADNPPPPAGNPPPPAGNPPPATSPPVDVVVYAGDVPASAVHGGWKFASDATSPNGTKLTTAVDGQSHTAAPLASPADYVDVPFTADGGVPYTLWLRLSAFNNAKASDSVWVQFFDASVNGSAVYGADSTSALLVNLASDSTGASNDRWGWANNAYWLTQPATVTFAGGGSHTLRIQVRETGVAFDQIVLSPAAYLTAAPGVRTNDTTIVPKPAAPSPVPSAPATPSPSDAAVGVPAAPTLTWSATGATTYDVRVGTSNPPPQAAANVTSASYALSGLTSGTRYFWQIVARNSSGASTGPVWSFTTAATAPPVAVPSAPATPSPSDAAVGVLAAPTLTWSATGATTYDVRVGTSNPPPQVAANVTSASYALSGLTSGTRYFWQIVARNNSGASTGPVWSFTTAAGTPAPAPSPAPTSPYGGTPAAIPGLIQAEAFDIGAEGAAYHDTTPGNTGGAFRQTDVDLEPVSGGGYDVGWIAAGEWLRYSVTVAAAGNYTAQFIVASAGPGGTFHLEANGTDVTGAMTIPDTGGWQTWQSIAKPIVLAAGPQSMRLVFDSAVGSAAVGNVDAFQITAAAAPAPPPTPAFGGTPASLPGRVEAENFDTGGDGAAYHDTTAGNTGGAYRATGVDLEACAEGGYNVGWIAAGEWLTYTVNVATAGPYSVQLRVASPTGAALHVGFTGGTTVAPSVVVPATGAWQAWTTVTVPLTLTAGVQQLRLQFDTAGLNVNFIDVLAQSAPSTPPAGGTSVSALTWNIQIDDSSDAHARMAMALAMTVSPQPQILVIQEAHAAQFNTYLDELQKQTGKVWHGVLATHCGLGSWTGTTCALPYDQGVALFTVFDIVNSDSRYFPFADCWQSARVGLRAALNVNGTVLQAFTTHLQHDSGCANDAQSRYQSMSMLKTWAAGYTAPQIVAGDFNAGPEQIDTSSGMYPNFVDVWSVVGAGQGLTAYLPLPTVRIDYWFTDASMQAAPQSMSVVQLNGTFSDHAALRTTFRIP